MGEKQLYGEEGQGRAQCHQHRRHELSGPAARKRGEILLPEEDREAQQQQDKARAQQPEVHLAATGRVPWPAERLSRPAKHQQHDQPAHEQEPQRQEDGVRALGQHGLYGELQIFGDHPECGVVRVLVDVAKVVRPMATVPGAAMYAALSRNPDFGGRGGGSVADLGGGSSGAGKAQVCSSVALPAREASPLE
ncbi:hypothetical protein [Streptomyces mirabilis]|uniref:hypothetical protein n=1 Tax=Streptomyces mirabilis TaxID=68239 RepID=UPI003694CAAE